MIDWSEIEILEDGGLTFWKRKGDNSWSRDIKDLIYNLKELEKNYHSEDLYNLNTDNIDGKQ